MKLGDSKILNNWRTNYGFCCGNRKGEAEKNSKWEQVPYYLSTAVALNRSYLRKIICAHCDYCNCNITPFLKSLVIIFTVELKKYQFADDHPDSSDDICIIIFSIILISIANIWINIHIPRVRSLIQANGISLIIFPHCITASKWAFGQT